VEYRRFGRLDWRVSALGFGAMRLPVIDDDPARIDVAAAIALIRRAIDGGVNYVDTAYPYHGGHSEALVGKALKDGYRERVRVATKMPAWLVEQAADFDRLLDEQLTRLDLPYIDFYLLHSLHQKPWEKVRDLGVREWLTRALADGRIRYAGFSFHDPYPVFEQVVDAYDWTFCQIYYNYLYEDLQAGTRGLRYAGSKGLGVVVMGPLAGGLLAKTPPAPIQAILDRAANPRTPSDWGLQWVWDHPEVSVALSGMNAPTQLDENLASAAHSGPGVLTGAELALITRVCAQYMALRPIACSDCKYCQPCPNEVAIPDIFEAYNTAFMHEAIDQARHTYGWLLNHGHGADKCLECGECEAQCPQNLEIMKWLPVAHEFLGQPA
jgi:predicted aldo/keto reductase-like oxidoreductase